MESNWVYDVIQHEPTEAPQTVTPQKRIGLAITGSPSEAVAQIQRAEELGINAAWLTTGGARPDGLTIFAAAAVKTSRILLGTSIVPTWPRHPIAVAQQVQVLHQLSGGRFRLGMGPSHRDGMIHAFGVNFRAPLTHLREYLRILKSLLQQGEVDFEGRFYIARGEIDAPIDVPVMASALRRRSYELCGEEADGAISWVCPSAYLRDSALPAMTAAAQRAGRPCPPLVAHAIIAVDDDANAVRNAVREQMALYVTLPFYAQMFVDAGFPEAQSGKWSDGMIDAVAIHGSREQVASGVQRLFSYGVTEIIASPVLTGPDANASWERTVSALAGIRLE